jgi:hypothetical protein
MTSYELSVVQTDMSMTINRIMCHLRDIPEGSSKGFAIAQDATFAETKVAVEVQDGWVVSKENLDSSHG